MIRRLTVSSLGALLVACGGGGESGPPAMPPPVGEPPPPPPPPSPSPAPSPPPLGSTCPAGFVPPTYPAKAQVRIEDVAVPPGASEVHVPVTLDKPTPNTIVARVLTRNGSGDSGAIEGRHFTRTDTHVIFRPGDPLQQTVRIPLGTMEAGRSFELIFTQGAAGGTVADSSGRITATAGAAPTTAQTEGFRAPRSFAARGTPAYRFDPATIEWSDAGGPDIWTTRLPHGRTQPVNDESGLYLDPVLHPSAEPPFAIEDGVLLIRSQQLAQPILHEGASYTHGAAILTGEAMPATQIAHGQYEWEAMMPNRRGGWPALWLLPTNGCLLEIDVYEGYGYNPDFDLSRDYGANLHGGVKGQRTFTALMVVDAEAVYGIGGFDTAYHRFAVDIAPDFITWFIDGTEVYQAVNPFAGTTWFPLMNVAVKHRGDYSGGTAAMRVRSFEVRRSGGP